MQLTTRWMLAFIAGVLLGGCGSEVFEPEPDGLIGAWRWFRSVGGIAPQEFTPESVGYDQTIIFGTDRVFEWRRDDSLIVRATFFVVRDSAVSGLAGDLLYLEDVEGRPSGWGPRWNPRVPYPIAAIQFVGRDTLILHDPCCDLFNHWYQRLRAMGGR